MDDEQGEVKLVCAACRNRGWYAVDGWPVVCTMCKVAPAAARRRAAKEVDTRAQLAQERAK